MQLINYRELPGEEFPAGRRTRVFISPKSVLKADHFVQGYTTIYPGGSIPAHRHVNEEAYTILSGRGLMTVDGEGAPVEGGMCVYLPSGQEHSLKNTGEEDLVVMFVYSPATIVDHWDEERKGALR